jgi:NTE family protein
VGEADSIKANVGRAGLILTGGGARAAYQVGVLKAFAEIHASPDWPFPIIVGTSAGAVSASILAGNVTRWHQSVGEIEKVWANFRVAQVFRSDAWAMVRAGAAGWVPSSRAA